MVCEAGITARGSAALRDWRPPAGEAIHWMTKSRSEHHHIPGFFISFCHECEKLALYCTTRHPFLISQPWLFECMQPRLYACPLPIWSPCTDLTKKKSGVLYELLVNVSNMFTWLIKNDCPFMVLVWSVSTFKVCFPALWAYQPGRVLDPIVHVTLPCQAKHIVHEQVIAGITSKTTACIRNTALPLLWCRIHGDSHLEESTFEICCTYIAACASCSHSLCPSFACLTGRFALSSRDLSEDVNLMSGWIIFLPFLLLPICWCRQAKWELYLAEFCLLPSLLLAYSDLYKAAVSYSLWYMPRSLA